MHTIVLCAILLHRPALAKKAAPPPPASASAPASPSPAIEAIPLTQIALRSEELSRILRDVPRRLPPVSELERVEEELRQQEVVVNASLKELTGSLAGSLTIMELREQSRQWRDFSQPEAQQRRALREWGAACEESIGLLNDQQATWEATLKTTKVVEGMETVVARIRQALKDIRQVKEVAEERLRVVVDLQGRVSKQALTIADTLDKLSRATQQFSRRLMFPEAYPIWRVSARRQSGESLEGLLSRSVALSYSSAATFVRSRRLIVGTVAMLSLAFAVLCWLSRGSLKRDSPDPMIVLAARVLRRPVALSVLMASPWALTSLPLARMGVVLLLMLLFLLPIVRLLPLFVGSGAPLVYFFSAFYVLNGLVGIIDLAPSARRDITAAIFTGAILILAWWGRPARFHPNWGPRAPTRREARIVWWSCAAMAPALLTNVLGFLLLSQLLRVSAILCSFVGLVMYTLVRVATALLTALVHSPALGALATVRMHRKGVLKWSRRALTLGALYCWIYATLDLFALKESAAKAVNSLLDAKVSVKALSISLGDVLGLLAVLAIGYLAARAIRFILREELLARLRLARGIPDMISTLLYYILLVLVLFMSLSAAGVQLDKLTVLTGAFGVGIGFGLQNVVNNFVSGLIIQFERPIRVGDVLEVGNLSGEIRHIGIRASTMRTFQGAEVIIPNSTFVSSQVVNWTLSEPRRRVDMPVHVAYGTAPERVIEILVGVARSLPEVLVDPAPEAFLVNFGPSGLEFTLMFWAEQDTHFRLRSEASIGINAALREAGITIPYPQQEIHVTRQGRGPQGPLPALDQPDRVRAAARRSGSP